MSAPRVTMRHAVLVVALAALCALAGHVGRADAVMIGMVRVDPTSAGTSAAKSLTATCPAGKQVISAGASTSPAGGHVVIDRVEPNAALTTVTVHADEDETGTATTWTLRAFVICAPPPPGLELVTAASASNSTDKSVVATCPSGKRLLGNGAEITGAAGEVLLDGQLPNDARTAVTVNAREDQSGTAADWSLTAYAICAAPQVGLERVRVTGASDSTAHKLVTAPCPAGTSVVGVGGTINSPNGQVVLDGLYPDSGLTSAKIDAVEDADGNSANWSLTAYAMCAATAELGSSTIPRGAYSFATTGGVACPAGQQIAGGGAGIDGGVGRVGLVLDGPGAGIWAATGQTIPVQFFDSWSLTLQEICATTFAGQTIASGTTSPDSLDEQSATVTCPSGLRVIGAGGEVDGSSSVMLEAIRPNSTLTSVTVLGHEAEGGTPDFWNMTAYAVCASAPPGLQLVKNTSPPASEDSGQAVAPCPAGTHLIGTGGEIVHGAGQVLLDDLKADAALTKTTVVGFEDHSGFDPQWQVTAYGICIDR
jgi:hypothetical protein